MSDWEGIAGGTLLAPSGPGNHLFIILIKSSEFEGYGENRCILANITSIKEGVPYDATCVLKAGCHPFIKQDSYVLYKQAKIEPEAHLKKQIDVGIIIPKEPINDELLAVVIQGLKDSIHTKRYIKELL